MNNILINLKEAVIGASQGGSAATAEGIQIQSLLSQINDNVTDSTVNGVNLISGAVGGGVEATQIKVPSGIDGQMMTIGETSLSTRSAMNASVAGLGLNGAPSNLDGLNIQCPGLAAGNIATAAPATQLVLQTTNYGDPSSETSQFPGQSWTFQFTDAANPTPAAQTPSSRDAYGNVLQQDNIIPVPLKAGFTLNDAMGALQQALGGAAFETNLSQQALPGQPFTSVSLNIAGNNIDPNAISSMQNLQPTWPDPVARYQVTTKSTTPSGGTTLLLNPLPLPAQAALLPLPAQAAFTSYVGARYLGTVSDLSNYMLNPTTAAFFTSSSSSPGTPDPNVGVQNTTTIAAPPTTNAMILSEGVSNIIAPAQSVWLLMPTKPAFTDTTWTGLDAAVATVNSAMQKTATMSQYIGNAQNLLTQAQTTVSGSIDDLNAGIGNLVDADMGKVSANLVAQQIRQQLAGQSLSLANQAPSFLLQLFK